MEAASDVVSIEAGAGAGGGWRVFYSCPHRATGITRLSVVFGEAVRSRMTFDIT